MPWFSDDEETEDNASQNATVTVVKVTEQEVQMEDAVYSKSNGASSDKSFTPTSAFGSVTNTGGAIIPPAKPSRFMSPPPVPSAFVDDPMDQEDLVDYDDDTPHVSSDAPAAPVLETFESPADDEAPLDEDVDMDTESVADDAADALQNSVHDIETHDEVDDGYFDGLSGNANVAVRKRRKWLSATEEVVPLNKTSETDDSAPDRLVRELTPAPAKRRGRLPKSPISSNSEPATKRTSSRAKTSDAMPPKSSGRGRKPVPREIEDEEYEVEDIVKSKYTGKRKLFLVKWKGFSSKENTWEPRSHLEHAHILIKEFEKKEEQGADAKADKKAKASTPATSAKESFSSRGRSSSRTRTGAAPAKSAKPAAPTKRGPGRPPTSAASSAKRGPGRPPTSAASSAKRGPGRPPASAASKRAKLDTKDDEPSSDEEWEVEAVLASEGMGRGTRYLVKWKGFSESENTWEPMANISHCKTALDAFKNKKRV